MNHRPNGLPTCLLDPQIQENYSMLYQNETPSFTFILHTQNNLPKFGTQARLLASSHRFRLVLKFWKEPWKFYLVHVKIFVFHFTWNWKKNQWCKIYALNFTKHLSFIMLMIFLPYLVYMHAWNVFNVAFECYFSMPQANSMFWATLTPYLWNQVEKITIISYFG